MRYGRAARERSLQRQLEWASRHIPWILLLFFSVVFVTIVAGQSLPLRVRDFVIGAGVACAFWICMWFVSNGSATTPTMMGAEASEWTSGDLRALQRSGWHLQDELDLLGWDIDHVLYGEGGVFAIETKWMSWPCIEDGEATRYVQGHVDQTRRGASRLTERLSKAMYPHPLHADPVLVVWGPGASDLNEQQMWGGVEIVPGALLQEWRDSRQQGRLKPEEVEQVHAAVQKELEETEARRPEVDRFVASGFSALATDLLLGITGAFVAMLITTGLWSQWPYWQVALAAGPVVMAIGVLARRSKRWRAAAMGWIVGASGVALFLGLAVLIEMNR